jgi:triosephosphate isomerase
VGVSLAAREAEATRTVVLRQLDAVIATAGIGAFAAAVIAYEPVWAIGTGRTPTLEQIAEVHDFLRSELTARFGDKAEEFRLLYGGSVKPSNATEIFAIVNVDGALVGGASLKATDFGAIITALDAS